MISKLKKCGEMLVNSNITTPKYRIFPEELCLIYDFSFFFWWALHKIKCIILNGAYINPHSTLQIKTNEKK